MNTWNYSIKVLETGNNLVFSAAEFTEIPFLPINRLPNIFVALVLTSFILYNIYKHKEQIRARAISERTVLAAFQETNSQLWNQTDAYFTFYKYGRKNTNVIRLRTYVLRWCKKIYCEIHNLTIFTLPSAAAKYCYLFSTRTKYTSYFEIELYTS